MKHTEIIPIRYPLMPAELPVQIEAKDGTVHSVHAEINDHLVRFTKNTEGQFTAESKPDLDTSYLAYLLRQLNRMFAN